MDIAEAEARINKLLENQNMLSTSLPHGYGSPEQSSLSPSNQDKIILKGQGRYKEVLNTIKDIVGNDHRVEYTDRILNYLVPYLEGRITREEFSYSVGSWFVGDNLKITQLMDTINEKSDEWKELIKDPRIWYDQYWKTEDKETGKPNIEPAFSHEVPNNLIKEQEQEQALSSMNPHGVAPPYGGIQAGPAQTIRKSQLKTIVDGSNLVGAVDPSGVDVKISNADPRDLDETEKEYDECDDAGCGKAEVEKPMAKGEYPGS